MPWVQIAAVMAAKHAEYRDRLARARINAITPQKARMAALAHYKWCITPRVWPKTTGSRG